MGAQTVSKPLPRYFALFAVALMVLSAVAIISGEGEESDAVSTTASDDSLTSYGNYTKTISVVGMYTGESYSISGASWLTVSSVSYSSVTLKKSGHPTPGTYNITFNYMSQADGESTVTWKSTVSASTTSKSYEVGDSFSNTVIGQNSETLSGNVGGATLSTSSQGGIYNVCLNGTITSAGTYTITSSTGCTKYVITVTQSTIPVTSVSISGSSSVTVGSTISLSASVSPSNATNKSVTWSVQSGSSYASVSSSGVVTGKAAGTAVIKATAADGSGKYATKTITVSNPSYTSTLKYNANGGSGAPSTQTYTGTSTSSHTFTISSTEPTRSGYTFLGWSTSSSATSASYQPGGTISVSYNGSKTLYAVWEESKQNYYAYLYYNANGGSGAPSTQSDSIYATSASGSKSFTISSTEPTRSGYQFLGWSTSSSAASASYDPGDSISVSYGSSKTLYAVWAKTYTSTLAFSANGGSGAPSSQTYTGTSTSSHTFTIPSTKPTKSGYLFLGWATSSGATTASYQPGGTISVPYDGTTTLYAVWQTAQLDITSEPATKSLKVNQSWSYTPTTNIDGCTVSVSGADWLSVSNGTISGTPTASGSYNVTVTVSKTGGYVSDSQTFVLKVYSALGFNSVPGANGMFAYAE